MNVNDLLRKVEEIKPRDETYSNPTPESSSGPVRDLTKFRTQPGKPRTKRSENNSYT